MSGERRIRARAREVVDDLDPPAHFRVLPRRIALVAVDRDAVTKTRRTHYKYGFDPFLGDVCKLADDERCDTIVYSLWSHDERHMGRLDERRLFGATTGVKTIFLETAGANGEFRVEVWRKGSSTPHRFAQRLRTSTEGVEEKRALMNGLPSRIFGSTLFLVCGEANIVSTQRNSSALTDPFGFMKWLATADPKLILNPTHDYMRRPEMKRKRAVYSRGGRTVLSVWNRGYKPPEASKPWQAFVDGKEVTDRDREAPFPRTTEIRVGVVDVG